MIKISDTVIKKQNNFWNHCLFHPTDAIEDSWGKRILDQMAADQSAKTIRIYAMLEDIVYIDMEGKLQYDFRANDLRLDYLREKGFDVLIALAAMPDCIAKNNGNKTSVSFNKTRYKGKMFHTSPPKDYALWEEVCYQYTKHIVERYGVECVANWRLQCYNEPDIPDFFMSELPAEEVMQRAEEYCKLYEAFAKGVCRASKEIKIGGPALALSIDVFLTHWLKDVKRKGLKLDFISYHNYGCLGFYTASKLGVHALNVEHHIEKHKKLLAAVADCGWKNLPIIVDEWGAVGGGFKNITQVPELVFRETEVFSAYFVKLIDRHIRANFNIEKLMICLSGQHEMTEEFTGFRGFFTLNHLPKPIYNAHVLAAKLKENLLECEVENRNIFTIPTGDDSGNQAVLLSYSDDAMDEQLPIIEEEVVFENEDTNSVITVWCIDKEHTNPYRLYERMGSPAISDKIIDKLREEGRLSSLTQVKGTNRIGIKLTPNATYLITREEGISHAF